MLGNFFQLDEPFEESDSHEDFVARIARSDHIRGVLYRPDDFEPRQPDYRIVGKTFQNVSFSKTTLSHIVFRDCKFCDCLFIATRLVDCEFHDCTFANCNTHKISIENTYIDPEAFAHMLHPEQHANIGVHLFQQLLKNATTTQQPRFRNAAEFHFRNWRRHQWRYDRRTNRITKWAFLRKWLPESLYYWFAGYGLRSRFFAFWTGVFFAAIVLANYMLWPKLAMTNAGMIIPDATVVKSAYFSLVTLTTLGYGDFVPTSELGMFIVTIEAVLGIVWISVLASTIIRRLVR